MEENNRNEHSKIENNEIENDGNESRKTTGRNKMSYTIWVLAGAYLLYTVYRLFSGYFQGDDGVKPWMLVVAVVFAVAAAGMIVMGIRGMRSLSKESAAQEPEEPEEPEPEPARRLSISEKAHLADNLQVPEGVVEEIEDSNEERQ